MILQELNVKLGLVLDEFQKNAVKAEQESKKIEGVFKNLKGALVSLGVFSFLQSATVEFMEAERNSVMLGYRLKGLGGDFQSLKAEVEDYAEAMAIATGIQDDELKSSLNDLIDVTKNTKTSMSLLQDIMDLHVAKGIDMKRATDLISGAFNGNRGELQELGKMFGLSRDKAHSFEAVMKAVRGQIQGASTENKMLSQSLGDSSNLWGDFKENVGRAMSGFIDFVARGIRPTIDFLGKLKTAQEAAFGGLYKLAGNLRNLATGNLKGWMENNKAIVSNTMAEEKEIFQKTEVAKTNIARVESGKRQKWMDDEAKRLKTDLQKEKSDLIKSEDAQMRLKVSRGQATNDQLLAQMKRHSEEIKAVYGEMSTEYQEYEKGRQEATLAANEYIMQSGQAVVGGISAGFEAMFLAIAKDGADASQAMEAFARAMGKSMLNSIATAVEGKAAEAMVGYLTNMVMAGPWGAAAVSGYSLPLIAALAASAGLIRGLAGMMAEGGTLTRPGLVMMAEKSTGEPETAIPLSRMDEVFQKYSQYIGKRGAGSGKQTIVNVQRVNDNRGAIVASSSYDKGRAAKNLGQILVERGVMKK